MQCALFKFDPKQGFSEDHCGQQIYLKITLMEKIKR